MIIPLFKIRASAAHEILAGSVGLTEAQSTKLQELSIRKRDAAAKVAGVKALTDKMEGELAGLIHKSENPELPAGAKSYCEKWLKEKLYDRRKNFQNKYVEKGIECEDDSIAFAADALGWGQVEKNEEWFSDDYMEGTPDIIANLWRRQVGGSNEVLETETPTVIDMKNVWDCFTLPLFDSIIPTAGYETQLQVYMHLVSNEYNIQFNDAILCYALMDAPAGVMRKEMNRLSWEEGQQGLITPEIGERVRREMTYSNLPAELRLKTFEVKKDQAVIDELMYRVELCRKYIASLAETDKFKAIIIKLASLEKAA